MSYKICFIDFSTKLETIDDLKTRARGGMVSSLFKVSDFLSSKGNDVYVLSDIANGGVTECGTIWVNKNNFNAGDSIDFLIFNRGTGSGYSEYKAKHRILWTHDLPHSGFIPEPKTIKAFSATVFMSDYAERAWRCFYKEIGKSFNIPNGVDKTIFFPRDKDYNYLIYASAPNRGLKRLPFLLDCIKARVGNHICLKAFSNLKVLHPSETPDADSDGFTDVYKQVQESSVTLLDPIPQHQLAEELGKAAMMILPTDYPEICSNIILQSLASGTPVVTTGSMGSAGEWVKHGVNGMMTNFQPVDYMVYHVEMMRNAISLLEDRVKHAAMCKRAAETKIHEWDEIGRKWEKMLMRIM